MHVLREPEVLRMTGLSSSAISRLEELGEFPPRVGLATGSEGWADHEIVAWVEVQRRRGATPAGQEVGRGVGSIRLPVLRRRAISRAAGGTTAMRKSALSAARQQLVTLMQTFEFGRIEGLVIREGEPVLDPPPRCVETIKLDGEEYPSRARQESDFVLKQQQFRLLDQFDRRRNGVVISITIQHGLPTIVNWDHTGVVPGVEMDPKRGSV